MKKNFAGIDEEFAQEEQASVVLLPVEYDGTSTWQKGADAGPSALLHAAENMELYDIETSSEPFRCGVYLEDALNGFSSPEDMVAGVYNSVESHLSKDKFVTVVGGEHSVSIGSIRAHHEAYNDLTVLQLDAHADLRPEYEGTPFNHACALYEASQECNLIQVGIRSMDVSERQNMNLAKTFFAHEIHDNDDWMEDSMNKMTDNVYLTIDLDVFDPSELPSTGTPEPGGLRYYQVLNYLKLIFSEKNVVGFDIVELCPNPQEKSSDFLAAKLYYKLLAYQYYL